MDATVTEWLNLALRWFHVIAAMAWIGTSLHFMWLDSALEPPAKPRVGLEGELWMVHSGGFYLVEKLKPGPNAMPATLHWFKWEALLTLVSGVSLLGVAYYLSGGGALVESGGARLGAGTGAALALGLLAAAWLGYDLLWNSPVGRHPTLAAVLSCTVLVAIAFGLSRVMGGRATFVHVGAILGTLMTANVWMRILPAQREMIAASRAGRMPDFTLGARAKVRSVHNSYMTFPVVILMLSNHYPSLYGHALNWVALALLLVLGAGIRHAMIAWDRSGRWALAPAAAALAVLVVMTVPAASHPGAAAGERVSFAAVRVVLNQRCLACHSAFPSDRSFGLAPGGVSFDVPDRIPAFAERIKLRAVVSQTMPLANKTGMTTDERALLARWIDQGARLE